VEAPVGISGPAALMKPVTPAAPQNLAWFNGVPNRRLKIAKTFACSHETITELQASKEAVVILFVTR